MARFRDLDSIEIVFFPWRSIPVRAAAMAVRRLPRQKSALVALGSVTTRNQAQQQEPATPSHQRQAKPSRVETRTSCWEAFALAWRQNCRRTPLQRCKFADRRYRRRQVARWLPPQWPTRRQQECREAWPLRGQSRARSGCGRPAFWPSSGARDCTVRQADRAESAQAVPLASARAEWPRQTHFGLGTEGCPQAGGNR